MKYGIADVKIVSLQIVVLTPFIHRPCLVDYLHGYQNTMKMKRDNWNCECQLRLSVRFHSSLLAERDEIRETVSVPVELKYVLSIGKVRYAWFGESGGHQIRCRSTMSLPRAGIATSPLFGDGFGAREPWSHLPTSNNTIHYFLQYQENKTTECARPLVSSDISQ